jgi:predicted DCC family thiol-disulfide oxidoreductase YuxK
MGQGQSAIFQEMKSYLIYNPNCTFCALMAKRFKSRVVIIIPNTQTKRIRRSFPQIKSADITKDVHFIKGNCIYSKACACCVLLGTRWHKAYCMFPLPFDILYLILKKNKWVLNYFLNLKNHEI